MLTNRPARNIVNFNPGLLINAGLDEGAAGHVVAYASAAVAPTTVVRATTYVEPAAAAQLEVVSSSANDNAAGTGTRKVRIVYYDDSCNGPFTTDVTLNGVTAVPTTPTNLRFIESICSLTVGNNGTNVGTITLRGLGGGALVGTIAASDGRTYWGHHYIATGRIGQILDVNGAFTLAKGSLFLRSIDVLTVNAFELQITPQLRLTPGAVGAAANPAPFQPTLVFPFGSLYITGPARITAYVDPDTAVANNVAYAGFSYLDV